jgi:hypothetical protein
MLIPRAASSLGTSLVFVASAALTPAGAQWSLDLEGGIVGTDKNVVQVPGVRDLPPGVTPGTRFSLTDGLTTEPAAVLRVRVAYDFGPNRVSILAAPVRFESRGTLGAPVSFNGVAFAAGSVVSSRYDFSSYRLTYQYAIIRRQSLRVGLGVTAVLRDAFIELAGPTTDGGAARTRYDNLGITPPLFRVDVDTRLVGRARLAIDSDLGRSPGPSGRFLDALVAIRVPVTRALQARIGYRVFEGAANEDEIYNVTRLHAVTGGLTYRF